MRTYVSLLALACASFAQTPSEYEGRPAHILSNGKLEVAVLTQGSTLGSIVLKDDPEKLNPLWNPVRFARETNQTEVRGAGIGHFLCVDGFGPVSPEEQKAGLRFHGEAVLQKFEVTPQGPMTLVLKTNLPLAQENLTRTVRLVEGENVVYVHSKLDSLVAVDRPLVWAEHATVGSPFLERKVTVFEMPAVRAKTRPYETTGGPTPRRFASDKEFKWPMVPLRDGTLVDIRTAPASGGSGDHSTQLLDRSKPYGWVTAIHPGKKLIVGWIFRTSDFPWLQNWESFPTSDKLARGLEFSTQPFDISRRDAVGMNPLFGAPTFRWLPAKSSVETDFAVFYTHVPDGFGAVKEVKVDKGAIVVEDESGKAIRLAASQMFSTGPTQ